MDPLKQKMADALVKSLVGLLSKNAANKDDPRMIRFAKIASTSDPNTVKFEFEKTKRYTIDAGEAVDFTVMTFKTMDGESHTIVMI